MDPITISPNRQQITFRLKDGSSVTQKISPTPKVKSEKLAGALVSLLCAPESTPSTSSPSFGTPRWELDPLGDAIHRHAALRSPEDCEEVVELVLKEADQMNHHPHIAREANCVTITCTTHNPRGLSARDTRLATKIDEVLAGYESTQPLESSHTGQDLEPLQRQVAAMRGRTIAVNRQKISQALESCACSTGKSS